MSVVLSALELAEEIIPLLDRTGYNTDAEFDQAVTDAIKKLKASPDVLFKTPIRNAIRDSWEYLKPMKAEMDKKLDLLRSSIPSMSTWDLIRMKDIESKKITENGLTLHDKMDRILQRIYKREELQSKGIRIYSDSTITPASPEVIGSIVGQKILETANYFREILNTQDPPQSGMVKPLLPAECRDKMLHEYQLLLLYLAVPTVQERFSSREVAVAIVKNILRHVSDQSDDEGSPESESQGCEGLDDRIEAYNNAMVDGGISTREIATVFNRYIAGVDNDTQFTPEAFGLLLDPYMDNLRDTLDQYEAISTTLTQ